MNNKHIFLLFVAIFSILFVTSYIVVRFPAEVSQSQSPVAGGEYILGTTPSWSFFLLAGECLLIVALVIVLLPSKKKK